MRNIALGATAYLLGCQVLYLITGGDFPMPDRWGDVYLVILGAYAGIPEVKFWARGADPDETWQEQLRRGGPFITSWTLVLFAGALVRHLRPTLPLPPELAEITVKVILLFSGTYALRQVRRARPLGSRSGPKASDDSDEAAFRKRVVETVTAKQPISSRDLAAALGVNPRTLARTLRELVAEGALTRTARSPTDPSARYAAADGSSSKK